MLAPAGAISALIKCSSSCTWGSCRNLFNICMADINKQSAGMTRCACRNLPNKFGDKLSKEQLQQVEELGLLADIDDQVRPTDRGALAVLLSMPHLEHNSCCKWVFHMLGCCSMLHKLCAADELYLLAGPAPVSLELQLLISVHTKDSCTADVTTAPSIMQTAVCFVSHTCWSCCRTLHVLSCGFYPVCRASCCRSSQSL